MAQASREFTPFSAIAMSTYHISHGEIGLMLRPLLKPIKGGTGMDVFAALDVSQEETAICAIGPDSTIIAEGKVPTCPDAIVG